MPTFQFQNKNINYRVVGMGKPLVMLNGIMMSTMSWLPFEEELSRFNQLILVDMLDQGQSDKMDVEFKQKIQADVVKALCDHLGLAKIALFGTSYGGEVALQFAVKYGGYVERLILFNTVSYTNAWLQEIGEAWNHAASTPAAYYATTIPVIYSPMFYDRKKEWMKARKEILVKGAFANKVFMDSMVRLTNSSNSFDVRSQLHTITAPTLIIGSENDHITPLEEQRYLQEQIPNADLIVLPNTGHASFYERPMVFVALVMGFVNMEKTTFAL